MHKKLQEKMFFLSQSFSGKKVGALAESSHYVINRVIKLINKPLDSVVEYGAGTGVMTKALLQKLSPNGKLIAIESNPEFVEILRQIKDDRLQVIEGLIQDQPLEESQGFSNVDLVVSSIPFSYLTTKEKQSVILNTKKILSSDGDLILFHQYRIATFLKLRKNFNDVSIFFEPRNVFPSFIFHAKK